MIRIKVQNLNKRYKLNDLYIKKLAKKILSHIKNPRQCAELEIIFLNDGAIKLLNKRYKNKDRPTDVLSFNLKLDNLKHQYFLGEIFISSDTACKNSKSFGTCFEEEIVLYVIHGILHLFGYEDGNIKDRLRMSAKQNYILKELCGKEILSRVLTRR